MYGQALLHFAESREDLIAVSADLANSSGLERLSKAYPERCLNLGIAEQNMVGVAAGIAKQGMTVFASSFAPFITMRACEQVRMNLGYMQIGVKLVGLGSGLSMGFLGNSHYGLEDIAVMRAIPGMTIVCPADCTELVKAIEALIDYPYPAYLRLTGAPGCPIVFDHDYYFKIGSAIELVPGSDMAILATGSMVSVAKEASALLALGGVSAAVFDFHTVKPLDVDTLDHICRRYTTIATLEEHSVIGGFGGAIAEFLSGKRVRPRHVSIGLPDRFGQTAEYTYLLDLHGLTAQSIAQRLQQELMLT